MAYTDYSFYTGTFYGDTLTEENAAKWLERASDYVDAITFHRTESAFPEVEAHAVKVKKAVCAIAEALYLIDVQRIATQAQADESGMIHAAIASMSSGRESISYVQSSNGSVYAKAANDRTERERLLGEIVVQYLAGIPDATGVNLLYAGVD